MDDHLQFHTEEVISTPPVDKQEANLVEVNTSNKDDATRKVDEEQDLKSSNPSRKWKDPSDHSENIGQVILEPIIQNPYDLTYTCLLIPRFSSHYLMGDISSRLNEWMKRICVSFGWCLEFLSVNPEYFQWVIRVPPATSTAYFMRIIRQQTSQYIFGEFPRFKRENLSKDFWALGYLISFGSQLHPSESIQQFIRQTRQQQGILPDG